MRFYSFISLVDELFLYNYFNNKICILSFTITFNFTLRNKNYYLLKIILLIMYLSLCYFILYNIYAINNKNTKLHNLIINLIYKYK